MRRALTVAIAALLSAAAAADDLQYQDGRQAKGAIARIADGDVVLDGGDEVPLGELKLITLAAGGKNEAPHALRLIGGDVIYGALGAEPRRGVSIDNPLAGNVAIPTRQLALVDFGGEEPLPAHDAGEDDVLWVRGKGGKLLALKGAMTSLDGKQVVFQWRRGGRRVTYGLDKVRALSIGGTKPARRSDDELEVAVTLTDGSRLTAVELTLDDKRLSLAQASGLELSVPRAAVASLAVASDWVLYLATVKPESVERRRNFEHGLTDIDHPAYLVGKTIYRGPLRHARGGIGTYATTALTWDIKSRYATLTAVIWVATPPGTQPAQAQGEVVFRVIGDGDELYASKPMRPGDAPLPISIKVEGMRRVTLEVADARPWGIAGAGCWGDVRVQKKRD